MGKSAGPPLPFVWSASYDVVGQGAAQQMAMDSALNAYQMAMDSALNAYQPPPPSLQELARVEVERLREEVGRIDWLWWGWLFAGTTAAILKAVL